MPTSRAVYTHFDSIWTVLQALCPQSGSMHAISGRQQIDMHASRCLKILEVPARQGTRVPVDTFLKLV